MTDRHAGKLFGYPFTTTVVDEKPMWRCGACGVVSAPDRDAFAKAKHEKGCEPEAPARRRGRNDTPPQPAKDVEPKKEAPKASK